MRVVEHAAAIDDGMLVAPTVVALEAQRCMGHLLGYGDLAEQRGLQVVRSLTSALAEMPGAVGVVVSAQAANFLEIVRIAGIRDAPLQVVVVAANPRVARLELRAAGFRAEVLASPSIGKRSSGASSRQCRINPWVSDETLQQPQRDSVLHAGECAIVCADGFADCDGVASTGCEVNTHTALAHCGMCDNACGASMVCLEGVCASGCGDLSLCAMTCVDPMSDVAHCGGCGTECDGPISGASTGSPACSGSCGIACAASLMHCGTPDGDTCVDTTADPRACGGCETACAEGERCSTGACVADAVARGLRDCGFGAREVNVRSNASNCGSCGAGCPIGGRCDDGACGSSCSEGKTACARGLASDCADLMTDPAHCGACNDACEAGEICSGGVCEPFLYAAGCWSCGNGNEYPVCCSVGDDTLCVADGVACP